ncbi:acyl-CoA dehydrogenase family protein [Sphingomonas immobilis]|uniref:Acyl-CoA dehydrogenase family protein n=1 Tax=Sphingomonas immobilis TaxID=3063997 RepID=A0ABT8ZWV7_9SPHN|nr:acyl-CoA dehydrogenase family protein [Sphingomonas sp. CA1-15]MDO7842063.1 acyl-CoA dehydrogenase family protein [Sphingomonas sp. CA1-15]
MKFHPSEEQVAIQDAVRGTLADVWPKERVEKFVDGEADFDPESWQALMALGLGGLLLPEDQGGAGLGLLDAAMVVEVAGQAAAAGPLGAQMLAAAIVARSTNDAAKAHLDALASGEAVATFAFGGDWLPESWDATPEAGSVRFVQSAGAAQLFILGTKGGGLALVEAGEGVSIEPVKSSDRTRRLSTVTFGGAKAHELFAPGDPFVARIFDAALVLVAADALGGAQYCVDLSVAYAKEREQFGQPIGRFQALKHQLAQMALEVEPARALVWYAGYAHDADLPDAARAAAIAKAHLADRFVSVGRAAVAAHGGIGYTWEYGLNTWFRRALFDRAYLGSPAVHRARAADLAGW